MPFILLIAAIIGLVLYGYFDGKAGRLGEMLIFWSVGAFLIAVAPYTVHWLAAR